jgi:hypothetical protein
LERSSKLFWKIDETAESEARRFAAICGDSFYDGMIAGASVLWIEAPVASISRPAPGLFRQGSNVAQDLLLICLAEILLRRHLSGSLGDHFQQFLVRLLSDFLAREIQTLFPQYFRHGRVALTVGAVACDAGFFKDGFASGGVGSQPYGGPSSDYAQPKHHGDSFYSHMLLSFLYLKTI